ncbi:MAG: DUF2341 domain-containing protein [Chloroflexota bacterium]
MSAPLSNFPVVIKITNDTDIGASALSTGYDIRFAFDEESPTPLAYEREYFDITAGSCNAVIWVKIPLLSSTVDTVFYIYYGYADAPDGENKNGVWDEGGSNNYTIVQHMGQDPSGTSPQMIDSTSYGNNGASSGTMLSEDLVSGNIWKAINFDGGDDAITIGHSASVNPSSAMTIEILCKATSTTNSQTLASHGWNYSGAWSVESGGGLWVFQLKNTSGTPYSVSTNTSISTTEWQYITCVFNGSQILIYLDGVYQNTTETTGTIGIEYGVSIGGWTDSHPITIDDFQFSNIARSADWIETRNSNYTATFSTFGSEEVSNASNPPVASFTFTKPLTVQFTDASDPAATSWDWDFGDETTHSTEQNPTHTYAAVGTYSVILTATNSDGSDDYTYSVDVSESGSTTVTLVRIYEMDHKVGSTQKHVFQIAKSDGTGYSSTCSETISIHYSKNGGTPVDVTSWKTTISFDVTMNRFTIEVVDPGTWVAGDNIDIAIDCNEGSGYVYLNVVPDPATTGTTAQQVWEYASGSGRTLSTAPPTANDIATAVWGATTKELTAVPTGGALEATLTAMKGSGFAATDSLKDIKAGLSSVTVDTSGLATPTDITDAVTAIRGATGTETLDTIAADIAAISIIGGSSAEQIIPASYITLDASAKTIKLASPYNDTTVEQIQFIQDLDTGDIIYNSKFPRVNPISVSGDTITYTHPSEEITSSPTSDIIQIYVNKV